ncbi:MAG: haloacid dehalogenase [Nocardioides sp.]|nr:haloacid dehalogenase [Nocardioides sp.]
MIRPTAVVLDLGNVLVRWDPHAAIAAGVGDAEAAAFLATDEVDFLAYNHRQDSGDTWAQGEAWLAEHHPRWLEHGRAYREHFWRSVATLVPGTAEVLRDLAAAGVPTYALTNWSAEFWPEAGRLHEEIALFRDVVVSGEVGVAKPDHTVYRLSAERFGHAPEELYFTDDSPRNVEAARACGWDAEVFTDAPTLRAQLERRGLLSGPDTP